MTAGPDPLSEAAGDLAVAVHGAVLVATTAGAREAAVADRVPTGLVGKDASLWGPDAAPEAAGRLGWLDVVDAGRALLPRLEALRAELLGEGVDRVVLAGMGGSSLAPEVICASAGRPLVVLDTTDPGQVRAALTDLSRTVVVCSSKSGGTLETDSHRRAARHAFTEAGIDPTRRIVVVTDPGSPLARTADEEGCRAVFLADPDVGGRYSALTAFGLVPSVLAGVDAAELLDGAAAVQPSLGQPTANPALLLGAALGGAGQAGRDKVILADAGSGVVGFGDWAEQLVAESTGKEGRGLLPVVVEGPQAAGTEPRVDTHLVRLDRAGADPGSGPSAEHTAVAGRLGGLFLGWEYATAVAGRILGINPFDQPNVQESKDNTQAILTAGQEASEDPALTEGAVQVFADAALLAGARDLRSAFERLLASIPDRGYLAVMAYLDRQVDADAGQLRASLAARVPHPVTFGWGPRFLHSTGQYHKGGPATGAFLQVTGAVGEDLAIPDRPFTFGQLQAAQAKGDVRALTSRQRPVLRVHLLDRAAGLAQLLSAARG